jgi:DinB superfamily
MKNEELPGLIAEATAIATDAERTFGRLSYEQLNWKRRPEEWSVAQCFDHLVKIDSTYFPQFRQIEQGQYSPTWRDRVPIVGRLFGSLVLGAVQPQAQRKFKAARHVEPSTSGIDSSILARFTAHQQEVIEHMNRTGNLDLSSIVVKSPVAPVVFYSLLDAFRIIVAHERRHMAQAERVTAAGGFPTS